MRELGQAPSQQRVPELNGVRGIAILLVLFVHLTVILPGSPAADALLNVAIGGWVGVELFFVLSGFLITGILVDTVDQPGYFSSFYARRALRILPLYYLVTIISFVVLPHIQTSKTARFSSVGSDEVWYWLMLPNVSITHANGFRHGIMDVTWSVAIEEHYYLFWPLLILLLKGRARIAACAAVMAASFALRCGLLALDFDPNNLYVLTPTHLDGIAAGSLIALLVRSRVETGRQRRLSRALLVVGLGGFLACAVAGQTPDYYTNPWAISLGIGFLAAGFSGFVLLTYLRRDQRRPYNRVLSSRPLVAFGKYSYALYLFNLPLRALVRDKVMPPETWASYPGGELIGQVIFYVVAGGIAFIAAFASYHLFEKHFLRMKVRFRPDKTRAVTEPVRP